ncbi:MAG: ATP-binding protein [Myxococcota bacterium]
MLALLFAWALAREPDLPRSLAAFTYGSFGLVAVAAVVPDRAHGVRAGLFVAGLLGTALGSMALIGLAPGPVLLTFIAITCTGLFMGTPWMVGALLLSSACVTLVGLRPPPIEVPGLVHAGAFVLVSLTGAALFRSTVRALEGTRQVAAQALTRLESASRTQAKTQSTLDQTQSTLDQTRQALEESKRLEAVGRLAGGVAHEFNNLLQVMLGLSDLLADEVKSGEGAEAVRSIQETARQGAELTSSLLVVARKGIDEAETFELDDALELWSKAFRRIVPSNVDFEIDLRRGRPVTLHAASLHRAVLNLIRNAIDAMPEGGRLQLSCRPSPVDGWMVLSVADTGGGIDPETKEKIFEPFFTTKGARGTGLGLPMVRGFVERFDGRLEVHTQPGQGTRFELHMLESDDPSLSGPTPPIHPPARRLG